MQEEIQKLLDHCVEYATELLTETGEAYPFGGFIDTIGQVHPLEMEVDKKNVPSIGKVVDTLRKFGEEEMSSDKMRGYAVTYEAAVQISEEESMDCIAIDIKHVDEELPVFYLPYTNESEGKAKVQEMFAVQR